MTASLLPNGEQSFTDQNGIPYAGGSVYMYVPGTLTPKTTYRDIGVINTNPVILDVAGRGRILGVGDYRQRLYDALGNLIWDQLTSAMLLDSAISAAMAPVVAASTLSEARDLLGVSAAINSAISNVQLITGPTGPIGNTGAASTVTGPTGPIGPTGPSGVSAGSSAILYAGIGTTDNTGLATITFPAPFPSLLISIYVQSTITFLYQQTPGTIITSIAYTNFDRSGFSGFPFANDAPLPSTDYAWIAIGN